MSTFSTDRARPVSAAGLKRSSRTGHRGWKALLLVVGWSVIGIVVVVLTAGTAAAQSGLEQSKSPSEAAFDQFPEFDESLFEDLSDNPIDVPEGEDVWSDNNADIFDVVQGDASALDVPVPFTFGYRGEDVWFRSPVQLMWMNGFGQLLMPGFPTPGLTITDCGVKFIVANATETHFCQVTNSSGTWLSRITISTDTVAPHVAITGVEHDAVYAVGQVPAAGCTTTDEFLNTVQSGVQTHATLATDGGPLGQVTVTCAGAEDMAGNPQNAVSATYWVLEPPAVAPQVTGTENEGWFVTDVGLDWDVSGSDLDTAGCESVSITADQAATEYMCTATNLVGSASQTVTIQRDTKGPGVTVTGVADDAVYALGSVPEVGCDTADEGVGESGTVQVATLTTSGGPVGSVTATCAGASDLAGNAGSASVTYRVLEPPAVAPQVTGTENEGWFVTDVGLDWDVSGSDLDTVGCESLSITADQAATEYTCTATNLVGSASQTVTIQRDTTGPGVTVTGVADDAVYTLGSVPEVGCDTADEGVGESGTVQVATPTTSGGPVGSVTATCAGASDLAGNPGSANVTFAVHFPFTGFFAPINPTTLNVVKAGRAIPVKFSLAGDRGLDILANTTSKRIACDTSLSQDTIEETVPAGSSGLTYDSMTDSYSYVWKTSKARAGTCRKFAVTLIDGSTHTATFQLR